MKILRKIAEAKIALLEFDKLLIGIDLLTFPEDSFGAAWRVLAMAVLETKIEFWRALCR